MTFKFWEFPFSFKDPASAYAIHIFTVHHNIIWYLIIVLCLVYWCLIMIMKDFIWDFPIYTYVFCYNMFKMWLEELRKTSFWLTDENGVLMADKDDDDWLPSCWDRDMIKLHKPINVVNEDFVLIKQQLKYEKPKEYIVLRIISRMVDWLKVIHYQFVMIYYYFSSFAMVYRLNDGDIGNGEIEMDRHSWAVIRVDLYIDFFTMDPDMMNRSLMMEEGDHNFKLWMYKIVLRYMRFFFKLYGVNPLSKQIFLRDDLLDIDGKILFLNEKSFHLNSMNLYVADFLSVFNVNSRRMFALDFGDRYLSTEDVNAFWFISWVKVFFKNFWSSYMWVEERKRRSFSSSEYDFYLQMYSSPSSGYFFNNRLNLFSLYKLKSKMMSNPFVSEVQHAILIMKKNKNACLPITVPTFSYQWNYIYTFFEMYAFSHNFLFEVLWAIFPTIIIMCILVPSFYLLYANDDPLDPVFTVKVVGHQWFWSYEFNNWINFSFTGDEVYYYISYEFDSIMVSTDDLSFGTKRLLEVDSRLVVPYNVPLRFIMTSGDVVHSWAVPELGMKVDAVPGRLNQAMSFITHPGVFYGQCSELCGVNHGFMPIVMVACPLEYYLSMF